MRDALKDHVLLTRHLKRQNSLLNTLHHVLFIKIGDKYYQACECYKYNQPLFQIAYLDKLFNTEDLDIYELDHLEWIGFKTTPIAQDCIQAARRLEQSHYGSIDPIKHAKSCTIVLDYVNYFKLIDGIKSIKFLPRHEFPQFKSLLYKIYQPRTNPLISIDESIKENLKHFAWTQRPILPSFCNGLEGIECAEPDIEMKIKNFEKFVSELTKGLDEKANLLNRLTSDEIKELKKLLKAYYTVFESNLKENREKLIDIPMLLIEALDETIRIVQASFVIKNIRRDNQINGFLYKLSDDCKDHWKLFESLGSSENVQIEHCKQVLDTIYHLQDMNGLSPEKYQDVIRVYSLLFFDGVLSADTNHDHILYAPNRAGKMKQQHELFYPNESYHEQLIERDTRLEEMCLFDLKDLKKFQQETSRVSIVNDSLARMSWKQILAYFEYRKPRPLSEILCERVKLPESKLDKEQNKK